MTPYFIELHEDDKAISLNIDADIQKLIRDTGCLIHKADPRLDTTKPLTMDDLKSMIGEPVWNSNFLSWWLVADVSGDDIATLRNSQTDIMFYGEEKLIAKPLYRMKGA